MLLFFRERRPSQLRNFADAGFRTHGLRDSFIESNMNSGNNNNNNDSSNNRPTYNSNMYNNNDIIIISIVVILVVIVSILGRLRIPVT